jgi:hypothetical protein
VASLSSYLLVIQISSPCHLAPPDLFDPIPHPLHQTPVLEHAKGETGSVVEGQYPNKDAGRAVGLVLGQAYRA